MTGALDEETEEAAPYLTALGGELIGRKGGEHHANRCAHILTIPGGPRNQAIGVPDVDSITPQVSEHVSDFQNPGEGDREVGSHAAISYRHAGLQEDRRRTARHLLGRRAGTRTLRTLVGGGINTGRGHTHQGLASTQEHPA